MKKLVLAIVILLFANSAYAQRPYFYPYFGFGVGTPQSAYLQGVAQVIMAQGYWAEHSAYGASVYQDAVSKSLDNRVKAVRNFWELKKEGQGLCYLPEF